MSSIGDLEKSALKLNATQTVAITQATQRLVKGDIDSPVAAFSLPANRGSLEIKITSEMKDSVFAPSVLFIDQDGNEIEHYDFSAFEYKKPMLIYGDRMVAEFTFTPPINVGNRVDMILYTTADELQKTTDRIHPARAMAEGKGNYFPEAKDIPTPHVETGKLVVEVNSIGVLSPQPAAKTKAPKVEHAQPETQTFYHSAIQKAVQDGNIPKALGLLEEAKALNIEGAQEVFVKAVNAQ